MYFIEILKTGAGFEDVVLTSNHNEQILALGNLIHIQNLLTDQQRLPLNLRAHLLRKVHFESNMGGAFDPPFEQWVS